jgi:hypothetical protein
MLSYLSQCNGGAGRALDGFQTAWAKVNGGEQQVIVLPTVVLLGSLLIVEDIVDGLWPTSLRVGFAEFIFAGFTSVLPYSCNS